jgi:hypothetical protein
MPTAHLCKFFRLHIVCARNAANHGFPASDPKDGTAKFDFTGTGPEVYGTASNSLLSLVIYFA